MEIQDSLDTDVIWEWGGKSIAQVLVSTDRARDLLREIEEIAEA